MTTAVTEPARAVDSESPWPGLAAFEEGDGALFKGRAGAIATLARLIAREDLTLLWSLSGLGKTSLLRAGLFPVLRTAGIFPIYVRLSYSRSGADGAELPSLVEQCWHQMRIAADCWGYELPPPAPSGTMWEYVRRSAHQFWGPNDRLVTPLLVFDQFEELFTPDRARELPAESITAFFRDITDSVSGAPPAWLLEGGHSATVEGATGEAATEQGDFIYRPGALKVLFSFREDYLAHVTALKTLIGPVDSNYHRLTPMSVDDAVSAVVEAGGHLIGGEQPEDKLTTCREIVARVTSAGQGDLPATVDPAFLSLFCRTLNEQRRDAKRPVIDRTLVEGAEASKIISNYYNASMAQVGPATRRFVESSLVLVESRSRESAAEVLALRAGATPEDLELLINDKRILRREQNTRFGQTRLELTHDILVEPALASRAAREIEEKRAEEKREQAARAERDREEAERRTLSLRLIAEKARRRALTWRLSGLLVALAVAASLFFLIKTNADRQRQIDLYMERALEDASSARPAQALARLAAVMRARPENTVARSLALDLLLRRSWLLPITVSSLPKGSAQTAFSSDGKLIATVSGTGSLHILDADSGKEIAASRNHGAGSEVTLVRFTPAQPNWILTVTRDGLAWVWPVQGEPVAVLGQASPITAAAFGPLLNLSQAVVSTASRDGWVRIWRFDAKANPPLTELHRFQLDSPAKSLEVSPDGTQLLAISDRTVTIWSPMLREPIHLRHERTEIVTAAAMSPDGRVVITSASATSSPAFESVLPANQPASQPGRERLIMWNGETREDVPAGSPVKDVLDEVCCSSPASRLVFSRSGRLLVSLSPERQVAAVWRVRLGPDLLALRGAILERVTSLPVADPDEDAVFIDDRLLVVRSMSGSVRLADPETGQPLAIPLRLAATSIALDPDRRRVVLTSRDRPPSVWALRSPVPSVDLGHAGEVLSAQFSPAIGDARILTLSRDGVPRIWSAAGGLPDAALDQHGFVLDAEYSADGQRVLENEGRVARVVTAKGDQVAEIVSPENDSRGFILSRFTPGSAQLVLASMTGPAQLRDASTGQLVRQFDTAGAISTIEFSASGDRMVTASRDSDVQVWETTTGKFLYAASPGGTIRSARLSADGTRLVTASTDTTAKVWTIGSSEPPIILSHSDAVTSAQFATADRVVTTSKDWTARIWTLQGRTADVKVLAHDASVDAAELDATGTRLLTLSSRAGSIRLWDAEGGQPLTQITPPASTLVSARFSPDGQRIVTAALDGYARVFYVPTGTEADAPWLADLCEGISGRFVDTTGATVALPGTAQMDRLAGFRAGALSERNSNTFKQRFVRWLLLDQPPAF